MCFNETRLFVVAERGQARIILPDRNVRTRKSRTELAEYRGRLFGAQFLGNKLEEAWLRRCHVRVVLIRRHDLRNRFADDP